VVLTASNGIGPDAIHTFTLTVTDDEGKASLYISPEAVTVDSDNTFTVTLKVNCPQEYDYVQYMLTYDPEILEFVDVTQIPSPDDWGSEGGGMIINGKDQANFTIYAFEDAKFSGDTEIAALTFKALNETPGADVSIIQHPEYGGIVSKLQYRPNDIDFITRSCTVTVVEGIPLPKAWLKTSFQGRPAGGANKEKLTVKWISGDAVIGEETVTTNENGEVEITIGGR
jgi:hypothetical protein